MTERSSRRDFLGMSALGLAASMSPKESAGKAARLAGEGSTAPKSGTEIHIWVTSGDERFAAAPHAFWGPAPETPGASQIQLDPSSRFQQVLGFGGALTDAACYMFNQLAPSVRDQLFNEMFHPSEMGLSVCRICVGSSDYSQKVYSFDEGEPDPELARFSIEHDREYILPVLRQARQANPDLFLFASPWSPPGWMKSNGSMLGGSMRRHYLPVYARYFLKFLQGYAAEGVPVQAVTPQNEVDTDQDGNMPACIWAQEYEIEFVSSHLGPVLESSGIPTKIWILDHNYNLWGRVMDELEDDQLRKHCNAVAWHGYVGTADMMSRVQKAFPGIEMYWTEGGSDYKDPGYLTDWCNWGETFTTILRNGCRSITTWNLALDEQGRPNIGPFSCGGVVTINSQTKAITRSGIYWALNHFSRFIHRGARRFGTQSTVPDLQHVGIENPDGQQVLVVTNQGAPREIELTLAHRAARISLKEKSVTTLAWR